MFKRFIFAFIFCVFFNLNAIAGGNPEEYKQDILKSVNEQKSDSLSLAGKAGETPTQTAPDIYDRTLTRIQKIWDTGAYELVVPVNTWHNRQMYDKRKTDSYNERPWGIGMGKYIEEDDYRYALVAMGFSDSHKNFEPLAGFTFQKLWGLNDENTLRVTLGMFLGITCRQDYSYAPLPAPLPILGVEYKRFSIESTYIPGTKNNGNVLFTWVRLRF
ncbi:MAG: lipid IV(A) palmitoyltransferase PagP [Lactobacillales bacterium]|nr:lipid IV(A) palmitoyltransferase PagP [Lactobacillales bacterium]